jgi:hypothetical protein
MKPQPFWALNHFTLPCVTGLLPPALDFRYASATDDDRLRSLAQRFSGTQQNDVASDVHLEKRASLT